MTTKGLQWLMSLVLISFFGCQKQVDVPGSNNLQRGDAVVTADCSTPMVKTLIDAGGVQTMGTVTITDDGTNINVRVDAKPGTVITRIAYIAGTEAEVAHGLTYPDFNYTACNGPKTPDEVLTFTVASQTTSVTGTVPVSSCQADGCIWLALLVTTKNLDGTGQLCGSVAEYDQVFGSADYQSAFLYCIEDCPPADCGPLRTQTPGGWGAPPNGNNPGAYLHANFDDAFGDFITVGCYPSNFYVKLTSAQAITDLLPTGGQAQKLTANLTDPASMKNVLVGHLVAITLAVGFDVFDADFGQAGITLGNMVIGSGTFAGWTVNQFLAEANKVLGGCSTAYTIQQVLTTATAINENYVDGTIDKGFLNCPTNN